MVLFFFLFLLYCYDSYYLILANYLYAYYCVLIYLSAQVRKWVLVFCCRSNVLIVSIKFHFYFCSLFIFFRSTTVASHDIECQRHRYIMPRLINIYCINFLLSQPEDTIEYILHLKRAELDTFFTWDGILTLSETNWALFNKLSKYIS